MSGASSSSSHKAQALGADGFSHLTTSPGVWHPGAVLPRGVGSAPGTLRFQSPVSAGPGVRARPPAPAVEEEGPVSGRGLVFCGIHRCSQEWGKGWLLGVMSSLGSSQHFSTPQWRGFKGRGSRQEGLFPEYVNADQ